ncbi:MAG: DUF853 family protein [Lachnospiraceae bacterium]|nr:DUF853 family protein [Lachnospiraceae bacterium]
MLYDGKIWVANTYEGERVSILPQMANRHGLIAGATGTGKTITLKVLAETFSDMGVPVFLADVKGDLAGMIAPGKDSEDMQARIERFGLAGAGFEYQKYPTTFWDIYGLNGIQLRTTISEMGPLLLARILRLNELQTDILSIVFKIADDKKLLLYDTKDLKAMLNYVDENVKEFQADYGRISTASIGAIMRALVALELDGGDRFFGETALNIFDLMTTGEGGKGMINILDSQTLINNGRLYSTFLLWLIAELFEEMPEVGDLDKPKMVFFFDEAHLLFDGATKALLEKIDQVVKLIRSKGIGIFFVTQNPKDVPDSVLAQLGNKIQHALRAYTPAEQKAVRAAASSFRENPAFDTYDTLIGLGTGQAVISFLDETGTPGMAQKVNVLPPKSRMGSIAPEEREASIKASLLYGKYATPHDPDSAYEFLMRRGAELEAEAAKAAQEAEALKAAAAEAKAAEKEAERAAREAEREAKAKENAKKRAIKSVGSSAAGTVGREIGKQAGKKFGTFGKTFGGNVGSSIARGLFATIASWFGK